MRCTFIAALALAACGRLGFATHDADRDVGVDRAVGKLDLGWGGDARRVIVPGSALDSFYVLYGESRLMRTDDAGATFRDCGRIVHRILDVDADAAGRVVVASSSGVYESSDGCATFARTGFADFWVNTAALAGANVLASTNAGIQLRRGVAWAEVASLGEFATDIAGAPHYLVGGPNGILLRSTDQGMSWQSATTGYTASTVLRFNATPAKLYLGSNAGVFSSIDGGASWTLIGTPCWAEDVAVDPLDNTYLVRACSDGLSVKAGPSVQWTMDARTPNLARAMVHDIELDPAGTGRIIIGTARGLFAASDRTLSFQPLGNVDAWSIHEIGAAPEDTLFLATPSGVLRKQAQGPYTLHDTGGASISLVLDLAVHQGGIYSVGHSITSSSNGDNYAELVAADGTDWWNFRRVAARDGVVAVASAGRVLISTDGTTFSSMTYPMNAELAVWGLALQPGSPMRVVVATQAGTFHAPIDGTGPFIATSPILDTGPVLPQPDGSLLCGTNDGLHRADSLGSPWVLRWSAGPDQEVHAIATHGTALIVIAGEKVYRSENGGVTFTEVPGFTGGRPLSLHVEPDGSVLVGTGGWGLYRLAPP